MMLGDGAAVSRTASHAASGPSSNGKGSVQQYNRQQTETSGEGWLAIWTPSTQGVHLPLYPILRQNIPPCMEFGGLPGAMLGQRDKIAASRTAQRQRLALT